MACFSLFHTERKRKENKCTRWQDCLFAKAPECGLMAPGAGTIRIGQANRLSAGTENMTKFGKTMMAVVTAAALTGSQAMAADLAPGKPAGVHAAQDMGRTPILLVAGAAVVTVIAVVVANQSGDHPACGSACNPPTTTTSTAT
jgi:hypothetical protein